LEADSTGFLFVFLSSPSKVK